MDQLDAAEQATKRAHADGRQDLFEGDVEVSPRKPRARSSSAPPMLHESTRRAGLHGHLLSELKRLAVTP
ncbi:MAG: hypothetical protein KIT84_44215 [Labilithrix sp.]|nr:hypothetical protein [Labilithrix sp.]MCW5818085.1 hypothetical protein [Labilithrix sp.]